MKKVVPKDCVLVPAKAERVFKGDIYDIYQWEQDLFDGSSATFEMVKRSDTTSAICIVDGKLLVLDDEQPYTGVTKSFPGGRIDPEDESTGSAIRREVAEETGYTFDNFRLVKVVQPVNHIEWFAYVYVAWGVKEKREPKLDAGEKINVNFADISEIKNLIDNRVGYLGNYWDIFIKVNSIDELTALPEYTGAWVDR